MALGPDESFATLAEADAYAAARGWTDWAEASEPAKEGGLRDATNYIVANARWPGRVVDLEQVGPFPRTGLKDVEGRTITGTPGAVKSATIEAARLSLSAPLLGGASDPIVIREKVDTIEVAYAEQKAADLRRDRLAWVWSLLRSAGAKQAGGVNVALSKA